MISLARRFRKSPDNPPGAEAVAAREFKRITRFPLAFDGGPSALKAAHHAATNAPLKGLGVARTAPWLCASPRRWPSVT